MTKRKFFFFNPTWAQKKTSATEKMLISVPIVLSSLPLADVTGDSLNWVIPAVDTSSFWLAASTDIKLMPTTSSANIWLIAVRMYRCWSGTLLNNFFNWWMSSGHSLMRSLSSTTRSHTSFNGRVKTKFNPFDILPHVRRCNTSLNDYRHLVCMHVVHTAYNFSQQHIS